MDLDETLIHSEEYSALKTYDKVITVQMKDDHYEKIGIMVRPYCVQFLRSMSRKFEIVIFTASVDSYANQIIDFLDPAKDLISYRLYRQDCQSFEKHYIKDLRIINRKLEDVI